jgi:hypothetical protein
MRLGRHIRHAAEQVAYEDPGKLTAEVRSTCHQPPQVYLVVKTRLT